METQTIALKGCRMNHLQESGCLCASVHALRPNAQRGTQVLGIPYTCQRGTSLCMQGIPRASVSREEETSPSPSTGKPLCKKETSPNPDAKNPLCAQEIPRGPCAGMHQHPVPVLLAPQRSRCHEPGRLVLPDIAHLAKKIAVQVTRNASYHCNMKCLGIEFHTQGPPKRKPS